MHVKNTYPIKTKAPKGRKNVLAVFRWPFIVLAIASVVVNLIIGRPYWCVVAVFSLYAIWSLVISPDLVEYNRISQSVKTLIYVCILLALIDIFLANGFALFVVPIVGFGGLAICIILFFSNIRTQKHNMLPLINFIFIAIISSSIVLHFYHSSSDWPYMVLLSLSVVFLLALIIVLRQDFRREMQKRFHVK